MSPVSSGIQAVRRVSTRNPRRRPRLDSDSIGHQPRRKRSKVTSETFDAPTFTNGSRLGDSTGNGGGEPKVRRSATPADSIDIPLRSKKTSQKRLHRNDAGPVMTQTSHYTLRQLSSTPEVVRRIASDYHGSILSSPSLALVVTRQHAYIWDHTSSTPVVQPRVFDVPDNIRPSEPHPFGQLIVNGASSSVGLFIVAATTGDMTYWENIETAESATIFRDRTSGVKGSVGSLFGGEVVSDITSAEHAGLILTLSSGRIAQVSLRDAQGKPCIHTQFLRYNESASSGLLGSLRNALGVGWKRDLIGVRTRSQGAKGQMQVISVTSSAQVQIWDLAWSGQCTTRDSIDFRALLQSQFDNSASNGSSSRAGQAAVVDFGVLPARKTGNEASSLIEDASLDLVFLVRRDSTFYLMEVAISGGRLYVEHRSELRGYTANTPEEKAKLAIPDPGHSAIITFQKAVAIMSLADLDASSGPEVQLMMESHRSPKLFQDTIAFQKDSTATILDMVPENFDERTKQSICTIFIRGTGPVRLITADPNTTKGLKIPLKTRIEQAVYLGTTFGNLIDFHRVDSNAYTLEEAVAAAIDISEELLDSSSPHLSTSFTSVDEQIDARQRLALALVAFLRRHFGPMSKPLSWKLLTDAEKLAMGRSLFLDYKDKLELPDISGPVMIPLIVKVLRKETRQIQVTSSTSDPEEVRHWFTYDTRLVNELLHRALATCNESFKNRNVSSIIKAFSETDDAILKAFSAMYDFRINHADDYAINSASIIDGIMEDDWKDLPEPWEGTHGFLNDLDQYIDNGRRYAVEAFDDQPENSDKMHAAYLAKVVEENCRMVGVLCKCYQERIGWCMSVKGPEYTESLVEKFKRSRVRHMGGLIMTGNAGSGLDIADKYKDMDLLVKLIMSDSAYLTEMLHAPDTTQEERKIINDRMDDLTGRIRGFIKAHGDAFANVFFDNHLVNHRSYGLLMDTSPGAMLKAPLTKFLRSEGARGKLGWINEVLNTGDLAHARSSLHTLATRHEGKVWNKKVELSLCKLIDMAARETGAFGSTAEVIDDSIDNELTTCGVQEQIYDHFFPTIVDAVDHVAELQLLTDSYAVTVRDPYPQLYQILEIALDGLLKQDALSIEQLVDILSLIDSVPSADPDADISGSEFNLALKALHAARASLDNKRLHVLLRLIWKRCYLQDDWDLINKTKSRSNDKLVERIRETTTCTTIAQGLSNILSLGSSITVLSPTECLGAGSTDEDLAHQFSNADVRRPIIKDNLKQDSLLKELIDKHQLQKWVDLAIHEAKNMVDEESRERLDMQAEEDRLIHDDAELNGEAQANGNGKLNGLSITNGIHAQETDTVQGHAQNQWSKDGSNATITQAVKVKKTKKTRVNGTNHATKEEQNGAKIAEGVPEARKSKRLLRSTAGRDTDEEMEMS